jgi:hypothetical protein
MFGDKPTPVPLCPPQIPRRPCFGLTLATEERKWPIICRVMAWPKIQIGANLDFDSLFSKALKFETR